MQLITYVVTKDIYLSQAAIFKHSSCFRNTSLLKQCCIHHKHFLSSEVMSCNLLPCSVQMWYTLPKGLDSKN